MRGNMPSFNIKSPQFTIERCVGETYCESNENINKFISDLQVDTWVFSEKIDYLMYLEKPVFKIAEFVSGDVLDHPEKYNR